MGSMESSLEVAASLVEEVVAGVERRLGALEPLPLAALAAGGGWLACCLHRAWQECEEGVLAAARGRLLALARRLPWVEGRIQRELRANMASLQEGMEGQLGGVPFLTSLPTEGWTREQVVGEVTSMLGLANFKAPSGVCHKPEQERVEVVTKVLSMAAYTNPLNPDAYPGLRKMEAEVVRMTGELFHGGEDMVGTMTSGGTESLILAVLAYRGRARQRGVRRPNLVMADTGHVGLDKAGHLLGVAVRHVKVDQDTLTPSIAALRRACDSNTIMLLASAPEYAHGVMDPVAAIAALGLQLGIPVHVDACLGGFLIVFAEQVGLHLEPFDFRVPGVTSISADTHKFGYAPKGSSVIMYSSKEFIHHQYYISADWTGGIFVSPTLAGSRSGGLVAATWAALVNFGLDGYTEATRRMVAASAKLREGVTAIPGLRVLGDPKLCIIAFTSDEFHIYRLADEMKERGWMLSCIQSPTAVHLYLVPKHLEPGVLEAFLEDLSLATQEVLGRPEEELTGRAAVYGMAQQIPSSLVTELAAGFLDLLYDTRGPV